MFYHRSLSHALDTAVAYDQSNIANCDSLETLVNLRIVTEEGRWAVAAFSGVYTDVCMDIVRQRIAMKMKILQSLKYNIGTKILMSKCFDHITTFPDTPSKIQPDSHAYVSKGIV